MRRPNFWLSMHTAYGCRHAGACCSAGWPIPVEAVRVNGIGSLRKDRQWLTQAPDAPPDVAGVLAMTPEGHCVFRRNHRCEIHTALGRDALPSACQHFPRECVIDRRGVCVTLSHFCPTAADLLFTYVGDLEIVEGPPPTGGAVEGFDARDALPPLLTPTVLMDHDGYAAWEAHMVAWLGGCRNPQGESGPEEALGVLDRQARQLSEWRPHAGSLVDAIAALDTPSAPLPRFRFPGWDFERRLFEGARQSLPAGYSWPDIPTCIADLWAALVAPRWCDYSLVINRFLAAHGFASWHAYQASGVVALIQGLYRTLAILRVEVARACAADGQRVSRRQLEYGIRQTDLLLRHLADRSELSRTLSAQPA